jgi:hypothetical protein
MIFGEKDIIKLEKAQYKYNINYFYFHVRL